MAFVFATANGDVAVPQQLPAAASPTTTNPFSPFAAVTYSDAEEEDDYNNYFFSAAAPHADVDLPPLLPPPGEMDGGDEGAEGWGAFPEQQHVPSHDAAGGASPIPPPTDVAAETNESTANSVVAAAAAAIPRPTEQRRKQRKWTFESQAPARAMLSNWGRINSSPPPRVPSSSSPLPRDSYMAHRRGRYGDANDDIGLYYDAEDLALADAEGTYRVLVAVPLDASGAVMGPEALRAANRGGGTLSVGAVRARQAREAAVLPLPPDPTPRPVAAAEQRRVAGGGANAAGSAAQPPPPPPMLASTSSSNHNGPSFNSSVDEASSDGGVVETEHVARLNIRMLLGSGGGNTARLLASAADASAASPSPLGGTDNTSNTPYQVVLESDVAAAHSRRQRLLLSGGGGGGVVSPNNSPPISSSSLPSLLVPFNDGRYATRYEWRGGSHGGAHHRDIGHSSGGSLRPPPPPPREEEANEEEEEGYYKGKRNGLTVHSSTADNDEAARRRQLYRTCDTHWFTFSGKPSDVLAFRSLIANDAVADPPPRNRRPALKSAADAKGSDAKRMSGDGITTKGLLPRGEVFRGRRRMNSPLPGDVLAIVFLFIPATSRRQMVTLSAVCQLWRYYANYCPHWTRLRLNTFVGGYPPAVREKLTQRKIVTRDELFLERSRAKKEAAGFVGRRKWSRFTKELAVFTIILALFFFAWAFAVALPALATGSLNTDGKIGSAVFFPLMALTIGEYFLFFYFVDRTFFADPNVIAGVGQADEAAIAAMRNANAEAYESRQAAARAEVRALANGNVTNNAAASDTARRHGTLLSGGRSTVAAPAPQRINDGMLARRAGGRGAHGDPTANGGGGGGRVLGAGLFVNGRRVAPAANGQRPQSQLVDQQSTQSSQTVNSSLQQNSPPARRGWGYQPPPAPPSAAVVVPPPARAPRGGGPSNSSRRPLTRRAFFAESSRTVRAVPALLFAFNLTATVVIALLWGRIRAVDGLVSMGQGSVALKGLWGGVFQSAGDGSVVSAAPSPSLLPPAAAYYTLPAPFTDPRWLLVNPLVFANKSLLLWGASSGATPLSPPPPPVASAEEDPQLPFVIYNYSLWPADGSDHSPPLRERWYVNQTDFMDMFDCDEGTAGGTRPTCFALLWFDEALQSPQFADLLGSSDSEAAFEAAQKELSNALIPQWWNDTFSPCAANASLCGPNVTATGRPFGASSVAEIAALLLRTVTADRLGFSPFVLENATVADGANTEPPACPLSALASAAGGGGGGGVPHSFDLSKATFVAVANGRAFFRDHLLAWGSDPYAILRRMNGFAAGLRQDANAAGGSAAATADTSYAAVVTANYYGTEGGPRDEGKGAADKNKGLAAAWLQQNGWPSSLPFAGDGGDSLFFSVTSASSGGADDSPPQLFPNVTAEGSRIAPLFSAFRGCVREQNATNALFPPPFIPIVRYDIPQSKAFAEDRRTRLLIGQFLLVAIFFVALILLFVAATTGFGIAHPSRLAATLGPAVAVAVGILLLNPLLLVAAGAVCIAQSLSVFSWSNVPPPVGATEAPFMCDEVAGGGMVALGGVILIVGSLVFVKRKCQEV